MLDLNIYNSRSKALKIIILCIAVASGTLLPADFSSIYVVDTAYDKLTKEIKESMFASKQGRCSMISFFDSQKKIEEAKQSRDVEIGAMIKNYVLFLPIDISRWENYVKEASKLLNGDADKREFMAIEKASTELINALKIIKRSFGLNLAENMEKIGVILKPLAKTVKDLKPSFFRKKSKNPVLHALRDVLERRIKELLDTYNHKVEQWQKFSPGVRKISL